MREPPRKLRRTPLSGAIGAVVLAWTGCGWAEGILSPGAEEPGLHSPGDRAEFGGHAGQTVQLAAATLPVAPEPGAGGAGPGIRVAPDALGSGTSESGAKEPLVFAQAGSAQSGGGAPSQPRDLLSSIHWNLARPLLRWSGLVGTDFFVDKSEFVDARTFNAYTTLLGTADTYLWQPWFAQIQANLGLSAYYNRSTNRNTGGPEGGNPEQYSFGWSGGARIGVFPFSRFPFEAYLDKSDVRTYANLFDQSQDNLRMGVRQRYQTQRGDQNYGFSWDRSILDQTYSNVPNVDDTLDVFVVSGSYGIANQA
ncbi:MAG TPA: hypothetical protein VF104_05175, partial [Burkholderiales bacterium]